MRKIWNALIGFIFQFFRNHKADQVQRTSAQILQDYKEALSRLPIKNPTAEDMAMLCPHLTKEQAVVAFSGESSYVACPPLRVRGAFQIVSLRGEWAESVYVRTAGKLVVSGTKVHPPKLDYSYAGRTPQSYADGKSHGDVFTVYAHMNEAIKFAEDNWGDQLILDTWDNVVEFTIQDPSDLYDNGYPKTAAILYACIRGDWNDICNNGSKPRSALIDESLVEITLDKMIRHELKGGRGGYTDYNCAYCGSGLGLTGCGGCGHHFRDDHYRSGWNTPLTRKMVDLLQESGHVFKKDPQLAWETEIVRFQKMLQECARHSERKAA